MRRRLRHFAGKSPVIDVQTHLIDQALWSGPAARAAAALAEFNAMVNPDRWCNGMDPWPRGWTRSAMTGFTFSWARGIWDSAPLEATLWRQADALVGGDKAWLIIDATALPKKGKASVGVAPSDEPPRGLPLTRLIDQSKGKPAEIRGASSSRRQYRNDFRG